MPESHENVRLSIPSQLPNIELLVLAAGASLEHLGLDESTLEPALLALREAVANGVVHGNREAPEKRVEVDLRVRGGEAILQVGDQGPGFDPDEVPDPLAPENLLRPSGRGIFLMRRMMDEVEFHFNGVGTRVVMRKRLSADGGDAVAAGGE
ncbi:MAG: ATP-binding protein [Thermoanaerobaculia bacterium]|nr:ATP-binding protein [Thermoanaerobaculia bacterium]